jgi:DNA modification methylase
VFQEVKRVLKDDGTFWLNLGDSYWGGKGKSGYELPDEAETRRAKGETFQTGHNIPGYMDMRPTDGKHPIIKPKDLIGIPWMVAFALRADGWYLRSDCIWAKPNPMPESVTDRCTKAHEYIFLLSKSAKYYYDNEAIAEPAQDRPVDSWEKRKSAGAGSGTVGNGHNSSLAKGEGFSHTVGNGTTRNKRDVWTVTTKPYKGAHFATFPPDLIEPCILAGTSEKGECPKCGKAWTRIIIHTTSTNGHAPHYTNASGRHDGGGKRGGGFTDMKSELVGWQPQCECGLDPVPQTCLDPFNGSGTTGAVSIKHGRNYIGCELNPEYIKLTEKRFAEIQPILPIGSEICPRQN